MANKEAYYFSHDSNSRNDEKIIALRMSLGWEGYGIYWAIIEKLRDAKEFELSINFNLIAFDLRTDNQKVKSIVTGFGLFSIDEEKEVFYSQSLKSRMNLKAKISDKRKDAANKRWNKNTEKQEVNAKVMQLHNKSNAIKERKGKEKKVKESKVNKTIELRKAEFKNSLLPFSDQYSEVMIENFFEYWSEHGERDRKMRFEKQSSFGLSRRLSTWHSRQKQFDKEKNFAPKKEKINAGILLQRKHGIS